LAFVRMLDTDYDRLFTCPVCSQLPHDQLILTVDGKVMGLQRCHERVYTPPPDEAVVVRSAV
jgi:transcription elongation factor Elf1